MITVENNYEPIIYEQPFHSHNYENHLELLHDYYTRPMSNSVPVKQEEKKINTNQTRKRRKTMLKYKPHLL